MELLSNSWHFAGGVPDLPDSGPLYSVTDLSHFSINIDN